MGGQIAMSNPTYHRPNAVPYGAPLLTNKSLGLYLGLHGYLLHFNGDFSRKQDALNSDPF